MSLNVEGADAEARARDAIRQLPELGITSSDLVYVRTLEAHGATVVRFGRTHRGVPVMGSSLAVRLQPSETGATADMVVARLGAPTLQGQASVSPPLEQALEESGFDTPVIGIVQQVVFDYGASLVPAYAIEVDGQHAHERSQMVFDARDGTLLSNRTLIHPLGRVYNPNPPVAMEMTSDVELNNLTSARFLTGRYVRASSCDPEVTSTCNPVQRARADEDGNFLYEPEDPSNTDEFAEVNVYFHTDLIAAYFRDTHSLEWTCCDSSSVIDVLANYAERPGVAYDNAFYSPSSCARDRCALMAFGQGRRDFGYDGDVVYHEFGHGIVDVTASLEGFQTDRLYGVGYEPGALNEGMADYFSATFTDDPRLADYFAGGRGEGSLRDLANDARCPDDLFGEVHQDGEIWGGALWSIREVIGADKADRLAFATLTMLSSLSTFDEAGQVLVDTAATLEGFTEEDRTTVQQVVTDRGLIGCVPVATLVPGETKDGFTGSDAITGNLGGSVAPIHYKIDIPADATSLRVSIESLTAAGRYNLHMRVGEPTRRRAGRTPPVVADLSGGPVLLLNETELAEVPLPRCDTVYISVETTDLLDQGPSLFRLTTSLSLSETPRECPADEPDAGVVDAGDDSGADDDASTDSGGDASIAPMSESGCGCVMSAPTTPAEVWWLLLPLAALWWRRRA